MRNLKLLDSARIVNRQNLEGCQVVCVDFDTKAVYCGTSSGLYVIEPQTREVRLGVSLTQDGYLPADGSGVLVGLQHIPDQMAVCTASATGDVLLWTIGNQSVECVGAVEHGLQAMVWSPDQEVIVLLTGQNTIVLMTRDFDPLTEVPMHPAGFGEAEFVNVGWGKKETQFHGSEGKQAALRKSENVSAVSPWDDRKPRVSWRGDGEYFAVSSVCPETGARLVRTWTREGSLHSTSEMADGIEQCLAWKPSGSLIATSQRRPNKHDIAFFERNGLRHGEFTLPFGAREVKVKELLWNTESSVLCVWLEQLRQEGNDDDFLPKSWVQLWTVNNYHWYLKQSLDFAATQEDRVSAVCWDPEQEYTLHILSKGGQYLQYRWAWCTDYCQSIGAANQNPVGVIDGDKVLVTPFRSMVVPPPMSAYTLQLPRAVNHVMFSSGADSSDVIAVLSDDRMALFTFDTAQKNDEAGGSVKLGACAGTGFTVMCQTPTLKGFCTLEGFDSDSFYPLLRYNFLWCGGDVIACSLSPDNESLIHLCSVNLDDCTLSLKQTVEPYSRVFTMAYSDETRNVALQMTDGAVFKLDMGVGEVTPWCNARGEHVVFAQPCSQMALCTLAGQEVVIGLTERFRIFVNNVQLATNCTSFAVHEEFLLLTTHSHTIRCISRATGPDALLSLSDGKAHPFDETVRRVERGSRLVCAVTEDTKVVLQMPRGNLETIHPRALVLSAVRKQLDRLEYKEAFTLMRKHRINMNLIHDHNPEAFLSNVVEYVRQIDDVTHINLFLTDLVEEDVTQSMYTAAYTREAASEGGRSGSKVDVICDAVRQALIALDRDKFLLSILTAHVRKSTPELDIALNIVKHLRGRGIRGQSTAEEALKYLLFLVDVNELYDVALGTYDFQLVLMVAEKSQKDPKEYLPFLNNLRKLDPDYQKFTIDKHLKRYRSALIHISKCGKDHFEECLNLVKEQRLFAHALKVFTRDTEDYKQIASAYGDYLTEKKYHEEAGLMYIKAKQCEQALGAFTRSVNWRQCLCMASMLGYGSDKVTELSRSLAATLKERRQHLQAACLLEQYANDCEEAIVTLIEGHEWDEALRVMHKYNRLDFVETNLKPGLVECCENQAESLSELRALFEKHRLRLSRVREEKEKKRLELFELGEGNRDASDLFSDTSSATGESVVSGDSQRSGSSRKSGSILTRVSGRSGKSRRKGEKKKWTLKEGSAHEDCALIEALANIVKQVNAVRDELGPLLQAMVLYRLEDKATQLQSEYDAILKLLEAHIPEIWDPEQTRLSRGLHSGGFGPDSTANAIALAMQQGRHSASGEDTALDPVLTVPPVLNKDTSWKLNMLEIRDKS